MSILLTDDEVVAAAIQRGKTWPHPLPTVELDADALLSAGARGARSLLVRGLARTDGSALVIDESICSIVDRVADSLQRALAYIADRSDPAALAGSSTYLYLTSDAYRPVVLDLVSASGVHNLREVTRAEGVELFLAAVENVFRLGIRNGDNDRDPALFVATDRGARAAAVVRGRVAFGEFRDSGGTGTFNEEDSSERWDVALLADEIGLRPNLVEDAADSERSKI